ncbi:MAG: DUF1194 domain-containing protein [Cyanobacteria bacterium SBLK]|nr:DUF1194 domain-containing protein [Cyanobacteria bacterium SBLK]
MNRFFTYFGAAAAAVVANAFVATSSFAFTFVNTELVLSVDVSGSVDDSEFNLQRQGYANAFRDRELIDIIEDMDRGIAVTMQYWSSQTAAAIGWYHITNAASANAFADAILAEDRPFANNTNIAAAINSATNLLLTNNFQGDRMVIDVSGDGRQNADISGSGYCAPLSIWGYVYDNDDTSPNCYNLVASARDAAVSQDITINGLPILTDVPELDAYFQAYAIGGEGAFLQAAANFSDFETAVKAKIKREIQSTESVPESVPIPESVPEPEPTPIPESVPEPTPIPESVPEPGMTLGLILLGLGAGVSFLKKHDRA